MENLSFNELVQRDIREILDYYEGETGNHRVGQRFFEEFEGLIERIAENPTRFGSHRLGTRRARFRRFPYSIVYRVLEDDGTVRILFVRHDKRCPQHGMDRTSTPRSAGMNSFRDGSDLRSSCSFRKLQGKRIKSSGRISGMPPRRPRDGEELHSLHARFRFVGIDRSATGMNTSGFLASIGGKNTRRTLLTRRGMHVWSRLFVNPT